MNKSVSIILNKFINLVLFKIKEKNIYKNEYKSLVFFFYKIVNNLTELNMNY